MKTVKPSQLELDRGGAGKIDAIAIAPQVAQEIPAQEVLESDDFDWNNDDAVILKEQRATAVYHNRLGELIIRQKAAWNDDEDAFLYVTPENCNAFIDGVAARIRNGGGSR
jgi:hypothetical protein